MISAPTWNDTFDLSVCSYAPAEICPYKIKNRIVFKIKTGYKLELLSSETMKLLGSAKKDVDQNKNGDEVPKLESVEVVLVHCIRKYCLLFVSNKQFGQLINISPHSLTMLGTTNTKFSFIGMWFTDQNSEPVEIEDNVNLTRIIGLTL